MIQHPRNGWFANASLPKFIEAVLVACSEHTRWLKQPDCKYIELRIDMRSGDFIVKNAQGDVRSLEQLRKLFPELQ
jgi:hypothetical protein